MRPVGFNIEVKAPCDAFCERRGRSGHLLDHGLDLARQALHLAQVLAEDLDPDGRADAGGKHVDAGLDGHGPGVGHARKLQCLVQLRDQLVDRHARAPLGLRLEVDDGFEHLGRCRVRGRVGAPGFAIDRYHLREALDDLVLRLHQLGRLGDGHAGQRRGHVQQRAFVERGHELRAELAGGVERHAQHDDRRGNRQFLPAHHGGDDGTVDPDEEPVHRVACLRHDAPTDEQHHQHGHQRHRQ